MKRFIVTLALFSVVSYPMYAGSMGAEENKEPCWGPSEACSTPAHSAITYNMDRLISFSIGPAWSNNGQNQTLTLQPGVQDRYMATKKSNVFPYGEIFFGMEKQLNKSLFAQLGLEVGAGGTARFRGDIWQSANPNLVNYTYSYNVNEVRILAKMKLLADIKFYDTRPFVSVGLGGGFNHAYHFATQPTSPKSPPYVYTFNSNVTKTFAYTFGFGFDEVINAHWHAGIAYEFANWGQSQLAAANQQTIGEGLLVNNIYINAVLLNLTYVT